MLFHFASYLDVEGQIRQGDLRIRNAVIEEIGPALRIEPDEEIINCEGKLILPAFYNTHTHLPMTLLRGYGENLSLLDWLEHKVFPFEDLLTVEDVYWGTLLAIAELLASGCCSASDMYFRLPGIIQAVQETGFKINLVNPITGNKPYREMPGFDEELYLLETAESDASGRIRIDASIHAEYTSGPEAVRSVVAFAEEYDLAIHLHLSESRAEHEACKQRWQKTPLRYFYDLAVFSRPVLAAHAIYLEDSDYDLLRELVAAGHEITLMHNPHSNLKLASGFAPLHRWRETGVNITVATDGAASNNALNILGELRLAGVLQKAVSGDPCFLTPQELLAMVTTNGARAQRRERAGRLAPGCAADLAILDIDKPHFYPQENLLNHLVYSAQGSDVWMTVVDGKILYRDGQFMSLDIAEVQRQVERIYQEKMAQLQ